MQRVLGRLDCFRGCDVGQQDREFIATKAANQVAHIGIRKDTCDLGKAERS